MCHMQFIFNCIQCKQIDEKLDEEIERAQKEGERLQKALCEAKAELQRMRDTKMKNRNEATRKKQANRVKIGKLT